MEKRYYIKVTKANGTHYHTFTYTATFGQVVNWCQGFIEGFLVGKPKAYIVHDCTFAVLEWKDKNSSFSLVVYEDEECTKIAERN